MKLINENFEYKPSTPNELRLKKLNQWKGWKCSVGFNALHIDLAGKVWGATCREGGLLGNIYDENFHIKDFDDWIVCGKDMCGCAADIRLPKIKEKKYKNLLDENNLVLNDNISEYHALNWDGDIVHVSWDLGKRCNYDCSYCPPYLHDKTSSHLNFNKVKNIIDVILEKFKNRQLEFSFSGGEPTLHPNFIDICKYIHSFGNRNIVTTNGSRSLKYLTELSQYMQLIIISHHFEFFNKDKMKNKIASLIENTNARYLLRLMMKPEKLDEIYEYVENYSCFIENKRVYFEFTPIRQQKPKREFLLDEYSESDLEKIQKIQGKFNAQVNF